VTTGNSSYVRTRAGVTCSEEARHTPHPEGYLAHMDWMAEKSKTHKQIRCLACGLWSIWVPKSTSAKSAGGNSKTAGKRD